jgi:hypothetical protein
MQRRAMCFAGLLLIVAGTFGTRTFGAEPAWRYVASPRADAAFRPVFRSLALSQTKPDGLREDVTYRGKKQKYARVRYGSDDSRCAIVVVDEVGPDDFDLYVDANRDGVIEAKEKLAGAGKDRTGSLDVEITRGLEILHVPRRVLWRLGVTRKIINLATLGYVEGTVSVAGKKRTARRVDGNANGLFGDAADRLWIDLNGDGRWDPITEQFPFVPVLNLNDQRYGIRGDAAGSRLAIEPLTAEGRIRLRLGALARDASLLKIDVMLIGEDGSALTVSGVDGTTALPAGRYAVGSVALSVQCATAREPVHFVFSSIAVDSGTRWHELKKDRDFILDPLGKLRFGLEIEKGQRIRKPGETIRVQPQLFTADGLQINSCAVGDSEEGSRLGNHRRCLVKLVAGDQAVDVQSSGFA